MDISSHDVDLALAALDQIPEEEIQVLRAIVARVDVRVHQRGVVPYLGEFCERQRERIRADGWSSVTIAQFFIVWSTNEASLARSLR
jgi:hypothetical protein